jgi:hypothetical protein
LLNANGYVPSASLAERRKALLSVPVKQVVPFMCALHELWYVTYAAMPELARALLEDVRFLENNELKYAEEIRKSSASRATSSWTLSGRRP